MKNLGTICSIGGILILVLVCIAPSVLNGSINRSNSDKQSDIDGVDSQEIKYLDEIDQTEFQKRNTTEYIIFDESDAGIINVDLRELSKITNLKDPPEITFSESEGMIISIKS